MVQPRVNLEEVDEDFGSYESEIVGGYLFRTMWKGQAVGIRMSTKNHGGRSLFLSHHQLADLLTEEDLQAIRDHIRYGDNGRGECPCNSDG